jgi:hypothetical protein
MLRHQDKFKALTSTYIIKNVISKYFRSLAVFDELRHHPGRTSIIFYLEAPTELLTSHFDF